MINQSKQEQSFGLVDLFFFILFLPFHLIIFGLKFIYFLCDVRILWIHFTYDNHVLYSSLEET